MQVPGEQLELWRAKAEKKIKTFREYNIIMWEVVNVNDKPAVGKAGQKIAAPFQKNNFICLCKPTATFSFIFFKPALLWRTLQPAEREVARGFLFQQSPPPAVTALPKGYTMLTLQRWIFSSLSGKEMPSQRQSIMRLSKFWLSSSTGTLNHKFLLSFLHPLIF